MKHTYSLYGLMCLLLFVQCDSERPDSPMSTQQASLHGNQCIALQTNGGTRSTSETTLINGSQLSLFCQGGIVCNGETFVLQNEIWRNDEALLEWIADIPADVKAYSPPLTSATTTYYAPDNQLIDWVYCDKTVDYPSAIQLTFSHLFSQICFNVETSLNNFIKEIQFTPSTRVLSVHPDSRNITCTSENPPVVRLPYQSDGNYLITVPHDNETTIDIRLNTKNGKILTATTRAITYSSGYRYYYNISSREIFTGISTAEDFVAFTCLINGNPYEGRQLEEFAETIDGKTTYRLLNDIEFTEEQNAYIQRIGNDKNRFKDCFDGQGHSLIGLDLSATNISESAGLFNYIAEGGKVKNVVLKDATMHCTDSPQLGTLGLLCGRNYGTIDGCRIEGGSISRTQGEYIASMVGNNSGLIMNCCATGTTVTNTMEDNEKAGTYSATAGLVSFNDSYLFNCYVANCTLNSTRTAGICYHGEQLSSTTMTNVYSYNCIVKQKDKYAGIAFYPHAQKFKNCFYDSERPTGTKNSYPSNTFKYSPKTLTMSGDDTPIGQYFNVWIEKTAPNSYPKLQFYQWEQTGGAIPFDFVRP